MDKLGLILGARSRTEAGTRSECEASARSGTEVGDRSECKAVAISVAILEDCLRQCWSRN